MGFDVESEENLSDRFRRGDPTAMEKIYWTYVDGVERLVRRLLVRRPKGRELIVAGEVEDLVQDAFVRAFGRRAREGYDGSRNYRPYLLGIVRNLVTDVLRACEREVLTHDNDFEDRLAKVAASRYVRAERSCSDPATVARAREYVARLSPELRSVHHQRFVLEKGQEAAARALGISRQRLRTLERGLRAGLARDIGASRLTKKFKPKQSSCADAG